MARIMTAQQKADTTNKPLTSVMEDYLEAIFDLDQEKRVVRVKDIARRMDVKMPTVTSMLRTLNDRGMVHYEKYEYVELTTNGARVGKEMRRRHGILSAFLTDILKVDHETADEEACQVEHALSPDTLDRFTDFMEFVQECPRAGESWLVNFQEYRSNGRNPEKCEARRKKFSKDFTRQIGAMKPSKPS